MNEITKQQKCIVLRNRIVIWIDEDIAKSIKADLCNSNGNIQFIEVAGELLNVQTIDGIFKDSTINTWERQKKGLASDKKVKLNL